LPGANGGWREESPGQNGNRNHNCYDARFCGLFLDELELRGRPRYPDRRWFIALSRADDEFKSLGPLKPAIQASRAPETSGAPEPLLPYDYEEDLSRSVKLACSRWLEQHNPIQGQSGHPAPAERKITPKRCQQQLRSSTSIPSSRSSGRHACGGS
jgi:hypothetical protein